MSVAVALPIKNNTNKIIPIINKGFLKIFFPPIKFSIKIIYLQY